MNTSLKTTVHRVMLIAPNISCKTISTTNRQYCIIHERYNVPWNGISHSLGPEEKLCVLSTLLFLFHFNLAHITFFTFYIPLNFANIIFHPIPRMLLQFLLTFIMPKLIHAVKAAEFYKKETSWKRSEE